MPNRRHAFALTALVLAAACARTSEQVPTAPQGALEPAPSAATPASEAEAPAPAAGPPPSPATPSSLKEQESLDAPEESRDEGFARPADKDDLGQAVAELERARAEFESAFGKQKARPSSSSAGASVNRRADVDEAPAPKAEKKGADSSCGTACRAYSSLGRAASAVCRLAGEKDARCTHAHKVVTDAEKRVAVCGCHGE